MKSEAYFRYLHEQSRLNETNVQRCEQRMDQAEEMQCFGQGDSGINGVA